MGAKHLLLRCEILAAVRKPPLATEPTSKRDGFLSGKEKSGKADKEAGAKLHALVLTNGGRRPQARRLSA
jgi:hypothetical protein